MFSEFFSVVLPSALPMHPVDVPGRFFFYNVYLITLWLFNIAMENGPFIDGLPIKNGDFPWLC